MKLDQNFRFYEITDECENGSCGVKTTRSLNQILKQPCVLFRGHIFSQLLMKLGQNVSLNEILDNFINESCRVKN